jgi:hypothetical protein
MPSYHMTLRRGQVIGVGSDNFAVRLDGRGGIRRYPARDLSGGRLTIAAGDPVEIRLELDGLGRERLTRSVAVAGVRVI